MSRELTEYQVFVASPQGLKPEREAFSREITRYNDIDARERLVQFTPVGWEYALGGPRRPQTIINEQILRCDYFVLVLHDRWGSSPHDEGALYTSGSEEEFELAKCCLADTQLPMRKIVILFKAVNERQLSDPGSELKKVLDFRRELEESASFLYHTFDATDDFREIIRSHLADWVREHEKFKQNGSIASTPTTSILPAVTQQASPTESEKIHSDETVRAALSNAESLQARGETLAAELAFSELVVRYDSAWCLARYARFLRKLGRWKKATEVIAEAIEAADRADDSKTKAYAIRQLGQVAERTGNPHGAIAQYLSSLDLYKSVDYLEGQARTYRDLALAHRKLSNFDESEKYLLESKRIYLDLDNQDGVAAALGYLGIIYKARGDLDKAEQVHLEAQQLLAGSSDERGLAAVWSNLAVVYRLRKRFPEAESLHAKALEVYKRHRDRQGISREHSNLGAICRQTDRLADAEMHFLQALAVAEQLQNKQGIAIQYSNLGRVYTDMGRYDQAEKLHLDSLSISDTLDNKEHQAMQHESLGDIAFRRGRIEDSLEQLRAALELFERVQSKLGRANCHKKLALVYQAMKDQDDEIRHLETAASLYGALDIADDLAAVNARLVEVKG